VDWEGAERVWVRYGNKVLNWRHGADGHG
jgi:hypothetical protein